MENLEEKSQDNSINIGKLRTPLTKEDKKYFKNLKETKVKVTQFDPNSLDLSLELMTCLWHPFYARYLKYK